MKALLLITALVITGAANQAMAHVSLVCGEYAIHTTVETSASANPALGLGQLLSIDESYELGQVVAVRNGQSQELYKMEDGARGFFGKKGFGRFMGGGLRLDLSNTKKNFDIYLEDTKAGVSIPCRAQSDCC